ncbi:ABC transporter substrate-binding protein [Ideonella sp. DXS29W]|uniref:ABC transporter substrate-binding protein n=1 Tax=Ideonella lacteola TaxID=2984193 RepID=A0ABU9BWM7_9BURK
MGITRRHFALCGAAALAAGASISAPGGEWTALQIVPLTGVNGGVGWHLAVGAQVAFAQANAGGPPHGKTLRLVTLDEEPGQVVAQVRERLRSDNPAALLSWHGRRSVGELARARLLEDTGLPLLGVMSGSLSAPGFSSTSLFATRGSVADEIDQVFRHAETTFAKRIALVTGNDEDGQEIIALARTRAPLMGVTLVSVQQHLAETAQVSDAVATVMKTPHDAVVLATNTSAVAYFSKLYAAAGGRGRVVVLSSAEATHLSAVVGPDTTRGLLVSQLVPHPRDPKVRLMRDFAAAYKRFGPNGIAPTLAMTESYIAARVFIDALQRGSASANGPAVQQVLASSPKAFELAGLPLSLKRQGPQYHNMSVIGPNGQLLF